MADAKPARRWWSAAHASIALIVAAWAFALSYLDSQWPMRVHDAIEDAIYRVFSGFPGVQELAHRTFDVARWSLSWTFCWALFFATLAAPLAFVVRMVARARVRAGHADPLERARGWLTASRSRTAAVLAALPFATQALFVHALSYEHWSPLYPLTAAVLGGLAQTAILRAGLRVVLAPAVREGEAEQVPIDPDELRFAAVAVTRETKLAVGALAALSVATVVWLASLPILTLFKDPRVFTVIAGYVGVAAVSALAFRRASRIAVGLDGIYVGGTSRPRFFAYRDLDAVRVRGGDVELMRRDRVVLRLQLHGPDAARRDAILARMNEGLARVKDVERDAAANFVTSRSTQHVADSARGGGDYRMPSVSADALWALVEGQGVDATTRTAAAEALARVTGGANRERLRVAAAHCADPRVRVALEEIGGEVAEGEEPEARAPRKSATA